jgi:hypothetical protein
MFEIDTGGPMSKERQESFMERRQAAEREQGRRQASTTRAHPSLSATKRIVAIAPRRFRLANQAKLSQVWAARGLSGECRLMTFAPEFALAL